MPVFVNSLVITAEVSAGTPATPAPGSPRPAAPAAGGVDQGQLAEEITTAVMRRVEQALDRLTER
jgi:hypothetical protein